MTYLATSTNHATKTRAITTARFLVAGVALAAALAACSSGQAAEQPAQPAGQSSQPAKATPASRVSTVPAGWNGEPPATGYPGAAALVSKAAASVPDKPILPPVTSPHSATPQYWRDGCLDAKDAVAEKVCVYGDTKNPARTIALVGGSITGSWFPALQQIAARRHWKIVTDLHGTCEWTAAMLVRKATGYRPYTQCYQWGQTVLKDLETKLKPDVVITSGLPEDGTVGHHTASSPGSMADIGAGMAQYWMNLENHGISVVAMRETPIMNFLVGDCVAKHGRTSPKCTVPAAKAIIPDPPTVRAARDTGGKVPVIDMNKYICGPKECNPVVGNVLVYLDGRHLTSTFSDTTTKYLEPLLLKAAPVLAK